METDNNRRTQEEGADSQDSVRLHPLLLRHGHRLFFVLFVIHVQHWILEVAGSEAVWKPSSNVDSAVPR